MRLRDLRWYMLAGIVLIISYAAVAFCYYLPIRAKAESSMKVLGQEATVNVTKMAEDKLNSLYDSFLYDSSVADTEINQTGVEYFFGSIKEGQRRIIMASDKTMDPSSTDTNYYFFFLKYVDEEPLCGRYSMDEFFSFLKETDEEGNETNTFDVFIYLADGTIIYDNTNSGVRSMQNALGISEFNLLDENGTFCSVNKVNGSNGVLSANPFKGMYLSTFIEITSPYLAINWVLQQAMVFYSIGIVVIIAFLVIFILGCKKASRLLRVDRHSTQATQAIVVRSDLKGNIIFTNKTFKQIYGLGKLEKLESFIDVDTNQPILETIKLGKACECSLAIKNDEDVHYFHFSPLKVSKSYYLLGTEITLDYLRRKHLFLMSGRNEITGCDNGFALANNFGHIIADTGYYDVAFIEYNIVRYEEIIGVFGRMNFNALLVNFLDALKENYSNLSVFQMSDSKFTVVFPNIDIENVEEKIQESLEIFRKPFQIKQNHIYIKCKIVVYNLKKEDAKDIKLETIQEKLDLAYKNIADFSNKDYIIYEPAMDNVIEAAEEMERDLVRGLQENEFKMYLQPQYDIIQNKIDGFEALIRWSNPKYIDKSPQVFIELAEQRGYMLDIGRFVIKETLQLAKKLEPYDVHVSMNVSPIQLLQVGFVQQMIDEFNLLHLKPGSVAIEITETFLMGNFQLMNEKLKRLKEMGFHIHLDDFCTGYSSMLYLKDLPVDTIKIDKEFTKYIETSKVHANIVRTICGLGTSLNLDIICEGVETQAQADLVKKYGARLIQGYLIGRAVPFEKAVALLDKYNGKRK